MFITNLIEDETYFDKFLILVNEAYDGNYKLKNNYKYILETYEDYEAFILLVDEQNPVAFCGLQKFYNNSLRTFSRYYLSKKYRFYNRSKFLASSQYILPWSIDFAKKKNYSYLFASFQSNYKRSRVMDIFLDNANKYTSENWERLKSLQNTCKNNLDKPECWQHVIRCTLKGNEKWNLISQKR